jgi:hypothetical protein
MSAKVATNGEQTLLAEAVRYYVERRSMNNPKGWAHVARVVRDQVSKGFWPDITDEDADKALEILDRLAAEENSPTARAWTEGVATALNYAVLEPDGITLRLDKPNPYLDADYAGPGDAQAVPGDASIDWEAVTRRIEEIEFTDDDGNNVGTMPGGHAAVAVAIVRGALNNEPGYEQYLFERNQS